MLTDLKTTPELAHMLFIEIVGYAKMPSNEQHESMHKLSEVIRNSDAAIDAEAEARHPSPPF